MENKIILSDQEKEAIIQLDDVLYDVEFIEEWINRKDSIDSNAISALQSMGAKGYYKAIKNMIQYENKTNKQNDEKTNKNELKENETINKETLANQKEKPKSHFTGTPIEKKEGSKRVAAYTIPIMIIPILLSGRPELLIIPILVLIVSWICYSEGDRELKEQREKELEEMKNRLGQNITKDK